MIYNLHSVLSAPDEKKDYSGLQNYLIEKNLTHGFADFWLTYKLVFLSDEQIILSPIYGVDRYAPYTHQVMQTENPFYIFDYADEEQKEMCDIFEKTIDESEIFYKKDFFNEFVIFHSLNILWHDDMLNVRYFRPVYEEYLNIKPGSENKPDKTVEFILALPSDDYIFINKLHSPNTAVYDEKAKFANFCILTIPDKTIVCSKKIFSESLNDDGNHISSVTTFLPPRKILLFSMYTIDKRSQWRYICIL